MVDVPPSRSRSSQVWRSVRRTESLLACGTIKGAEQTGIGSETAGLGYSMLRTGGLVIVRRENDTLAYRLT